ncbi:MAG: ATP-dependent DNA helicase [Methanolinea sp.]|jgi:helicase|nr:ATP-dependent DNA helicase [Methanolinea sp.]
MKVATLPIPAYLQERYRTLGIVDLYPPQAECVEKGLFETKNLLVTIPTASGKTLIAEMAMHAHASRRGKSLYIVPLKALASEKYDEFGGKGVKVGISTGDFDRRDDYLGRNDIIVATSEKVDSLIRNRAPWLRDISLLVVDEVHLLDSPDRGPTLEMVITKMRARNPAMQVIGLSATIGNPRILAGWLDAALVTSSWRPVDLRQGVYLNGEIRFDENARPVATVSKHEDINLLVDTVAEGGQCIFFVSSRKNAEAFAKRAAKALKCEDPELDQYRNRLKKIAGTEMGESLASCVGMGAAFHHAGLPREARAIVEEGFRKGLIRCISSTPTLAAGLNLPARRVVVRDYRRYETGAGMVPIPAREYHQMAGRAGRPRLDPYGESVLIAKDEEERHTLFEFYIHAPAEDVNSQCANESALTTHILSLIASGFVSCDAEIQEFLGRTFYQYQHRGSRLIGSVTERALRFLDAAEMVVENGGRLSATEYGALVSQLYIDPRGAESIVTRMCSADEYSDTGLLQILCSTPDMYTLYVNNRDLHYLERFLFEHEEELWLPLEFGEEEEFYRALKTAMLLRDWSMEVPEPTICERYSVGPGDIFNLVESVNWLMHASGRLSTMFVPRFARDVREYEVCMKHGIKRELLPLVSLRNIGRVRARSLFNNGITCPEDLKKADPGKVSAILGRGIAAQVMRQLERDEANGEDEPSVSGQVTLSSFKEGG